MQHFAHQAFADLAAGEELAFAAANGELLTQNVMLIVGSSTVVTGSAFGRIDGADRVGNAQGFDTGNRYDVAGFGFRNLLAFQAHETKHLEHAAIALLAIAIDDRDRHVRAHLAALDAADADQADVGAVVELAQAHLERTVRIDLRRRHVLHDRLVQRGHVAFARIRVQARVAIQGRGVNDRKVQLLVRRTETIEQVEGLIQHPIRACAGAVDLVDHDDGLEAHLERLLGDEARLRHRAFHRVDQQQHRVDHRQHALDFAAEIRVAGRVDDIDAVVAPGDRGVLGENRDAALLFLVVRVHHALGEHGALAERARLLEQAVDESGLAVVDVGDDGDIAQVFDGHGDRPAGERARSKGQAVNYTGNCCSVRNHPCRAESQPGYP